MTRPVPQTSQETNGRVMFTPDPAVSGPLVDVPDDRNPELVKEHISTVLSTAAILMIVVGLTWAVWGRIGPWALTVGGATLALLVSIADAGRRPGAAPAPAVPPAVRRGPVPGPTDRGTLHAKGPGATA